MHDQNHDPEESSSHYNGVRRKIHEIIFEADTPLGALFDISLMIAIVLSVIVTCLATVPDYKDQPWIDVLALIFTVLFTVEYGLRIYCVQRPGRYIFSFWGMIDLLSILPDYVLFFSSNSTTRAFSVIRSLRLLRVFRIFKLGWFQSEADDLGGAIWRARAKIIVFLTVVMIIVTVTGTLMYEVELIFLEGSELESDFQSIPEGIYWAIVTMTTVGFGDLVPKSAPGKFLSAILILLGYSLIIVPTGFVSAEIIESRKRRITTRSCSSCITEGHDLDAKHCKYCGELL
jgi:voltage-gated potassium channel